ncbi:MAG: hypothetical protein OHK0056_30240 [Bacteriovoracaceae bacterium]
MGRENSRSTQFHKSSSQPLWNLIEKDVLDDLNKYLEGGKDTYKSVYNQKPR